MQFQGILWHSKTQPSVPVQQLHASTMPLSAAHHLSSPASLSVTQGSAASAAAAKGAARAATKLSLTGSSSSSTAAATTVPCLADKERLAAQIAVKEKVLKLLQKQKNAADPATRARLQHKFDKVLGRAAASSGQAAGAAATAAPAHVDAQAHTAAAAGGGAARGGAVQRAKLQKQQQRRPLAGIASVLAVTSAEQVRTETPSRP